MEIIDRGVLMKRILGFIIYFLITIALAFILLNYEFRAIDNIYLKTFWHNLKFISSTLYTLIPLVLLLAFLLLLFTNRWALRVEKLSIGGFSLIFDNPAHLYKRQIRNLLNTKRTIFKIDYEHDNFNETLNSYYEVYQFFRDEIKVLGDMRKKRFINNEAMALYALTNETISVLNGFLTKNQCNYRRWYTYIEKTNEEKYYLTPIGKLQKEYPYYDKLCCGFETVNKFFVDKVADEFEVDTHKWGMK